MRDEELMTGSPMFEARKKGATLELERDPHPSTTRYLAIEAPGLLVLFPKDGIAPAAVPVQVAVPERVEPERDALLHRAFAHLKSRVDVSEWTSSATPYTDLVNCLRALAVQAPVSQDVGEYLSKNPCVSSATEMLFTAIAMSARAQWELAPPRIRGVVARGWFLGRWIPTFLVFDGPILRFLKSEAFKRQSPSQSLLRAVRRFFETADFRNMRHAFAHWSFAWEVSAGDSTVVGRDTTPSGTRETVRLSLTEADAFHIVTFAVIEAIDEIFIRPRR